MQTYSEEQIAKAQDDYHRNLELAAYHLYEAERAQRVDRQLQPWITAAPAMLADARYRIRSAHHRGDQTIKAKLPLVIAQTLAVFDGWIWPTCDNKPQPDGMGREQYAADVARRREGYRFRGELIVTALFNYLDVNAWGEPESLRVDQVTRFRQLQSEDAEAMQTWTERRVAQVLGKGEADARD